MPKLTDTQLVILSAAARRRDGTTLPLPKSLSHVVEAVDGGFVWNGVPCLARKVRTARWLQYW